MHVWDTGQDTGTGPPSGAAHGFGAEACRPRGSSETKTRFRVSFLRVALLKIPSVGPSAGLSGLSVY